MRHRKSLLEDRGDAFVGAAGGRGDVRGIFEILAGKHLAFHRKPIVLLNVEGFYGPLLAMIEHGIEHKFIKASLRDLYFVARNVKEAMGFLESYRPPDVERPTSDIAE